ncbi:hypothetical protein HDU87_002490 [Geranomyces variabilis]|uniref:Uncharacterized protein n=1 Tax=Geranomyces variabilis TaxID=109894 RepID=A0AAD5XL30_9FUNG|nr:hypothetical protein HDU87_002490 [Geranomyces variabilis]
MTVTIQVTNREAAAVKIYQDESHYLANAAPYKKEGCGQVIKETPWDPKITSGVDNGFVDSIVRAYNHHHKLILRPDDVWLAIAVQFGLFVNGNANELRSHFVQHTGKKELVVSAIADIETADYAKLLSSDMVKALKDNVTDTELCDWILPAFSTTTPSDVVVGSIVLMASMNSYFDYKMELMCGIPEITLLGTVADWELIHARVAKLRKYGSECAKWATMLEKITENIARTARGETPENFWQTICHYNSTGSGPRYLSGWLSAFCVFNDKGNWQGDNTRVKTWNGHIIEGNEFPVIDFSDVPAGYLTVPMKLDDNGRLYDTLLFAGHASFTISAIDTVQPTLSWALFTKDDELVEK